MEFYATTTRKKTVDIHNNMDLSQKYYTEKKELRNKVKHTV